MKIGIIVHSFTGNTYAVAQKLEEKLTRAGHTVNVERIKLVGGEQPNKPEFQLENPPPTAAYDALIFGAPVRGFSVSPVIAAYLQQITTLSGKKVACYVTKHLANKWTGGNRAISTMTKICESKGAKVAGTEILFWNSKKGAPNLEEPVGRLSRLFE